MSDEDLNLRMKLTGDREAAGGVKKVADGVEKLGTQSKKTGNEQENAARKSRMFSRGIDESAVSARTAMDHVKRLAFAVGGAALAYGSVHGIEQSIDRTVQLTKASALLTRTYGLSQTAASQYAIVADTLGVDQDAFAKSMMKVGGAVATAVSQQGAYAAQQEKSRTKVAGLRSELNKLSDTEKNRSKRQKLQQQIDAQTNAATHIAVGKNAAAFKALGVSQKLLRSGNTDAIFKATLDGLHKMPGSLQKATLESQIFGARGIKALKPILAMSGKQFEEWQKKGADAAKKLDPKLVAKYTAEQREQKLMWTELSVTVGTAVLPRMMKLEHATLAAMEAFKKGDGTMGQVKGTLKKVASLIGNVTDALEQHPTAAVRSVEALAGAAAVIWGINKATKAWEATQAATATVIKLFTVSTEAEQIALSQTKIAMIVSGAATKAWTVLTEGAAAAQWLLNVALDANPIGLVIVAVFALGAAFVLAYKKVKWFRDGVNTVIDFVKKHWKGMLIALTGGIGLAVVAIVSHWDSIKSGFSDVMDWIQNKWNTFVGIFNKGIHAFNVINPGKDIPDIPTWGGGGGGGGGAAAPAIPTKAAAANANTSLAGATGGFVPAQSKITPGMLGAKFASTRTASGGGGAEVVHLHVDGKVMASAVLKHGKWVAARA